MTRSTDADGGRVCSLFGWFRTRQSRRTMSTLSGPNPSQTSLGWVHSVQAATVIREGLSYTKEAVLYGDNVEQVVSGVPSIQLTG